MYTCEHYEIHMLVLQIIASKFNHPRLRILVNTLFYLFVPMVQICVSHIAAELARVPARREEWASCIRQRRDFPIRRWPLPVGVWGEHTLSRMIQLVLHPTSNKLWNNHTYAKRITVRLHIRVCGLHSTRIYQNKPRFFLEGRF